MEFLPAFFNIKNKRCVIIGGGEIATRKAALLIEAQGKVHVVAPEISSAMQTLVTDNKGSIKQGRYQDSDLDGAHLVIAATDDEALNQAVSVAAQQRQIPINVVDNPSLCSFILPAIVDRSPIVVAVSSGGQSPVLTRLIRGKLETLIPAAYGELADVVGTFRDQVKRKFNSISERRMFWEEVLQGPVAELVFAGKKSQAETLLREQLKDHDQVKEPVGEVYLVGGGPGDPDLLTFRALRLMQQADVVLYDRLVAPQIVNLCRRDAEKIYVGKARDKHLVPQGDINALLIKLAKEGKRVCRLKGGDPFIFGRGGEEIDQLAEQGIPFQVVPGITAASGCASYAGIPLTHRDYSQSVRFITGHLKDGAPDLNWQGLIQDRETLVFYMGLIGLEKICSSLIAHGMSADMPIALVEKGTTSQQRVITATLATMHDKIKSYDVHAPTLIIVGQVVKLREKLNWFEQLNQQSQGE
ncbi:MAG TPA: siroheme synthase CysG [Pseudomonadales bacterium]